MEFKPIAKVDFKSSIAERAPEDYTARPERRAYVQTNFDRRGNVRGYSVYNPQGRLIKRYEARTYLNKRLCFELASGLRDSLNALLEQTERQPEAPFVAPPIEGR